MDSKLSKEETELIVGRRINRFEGQEDWYVIDEFLLESWEELEKY